LNHSLPPCEGTSCSSAATSGQKATGRPLLSLSISHARRPVMIFCAADQRNSLRALSRGAGPPGGGPSRRVIAAPSLIVLASPSLRPATSGTDDCDWARICVQR
jgi:hypothetical protein